MVSVWVRDTENVPGNCAALDSDNLIDGAPVSDRIISISKKLRGTFFWIAFISASLAANRAAYRWIRKISELSQYLISSGVNQFGSGLVFLGGLIGGLLSVSFYIYKNKLHFSLNS